MYLLCNCSSLNFGLEELVFSSFFACFLLCLLVLILDSVVHLFRCQTLHVWKFVFSCLPCSPTNNNYVFLLLFLFVFYS